MTDDRRLRIEELFEAALEVSPAERPAWLAGVCAGDAKARAEVAALLAAHDRAEGALDRPIAGLAASLLDISRLGGSLDEQFADRHIGPYRVLRELGRGGMGVVYLAERDDGQFRRRVAIKVVRSGFDDGQIQRRFLAERQILASLGHPNIAQLLDGGVTDGRLPYLVMEYVDGQPIATYCDTHGLGVETRLRLFRDVCAAVQHAHQNLVIHRDLKPANIVVDATGRVKLLDFGIAKLLNPSLAPVDTPLTRLEQRVMTLDYASPEQVRGETLTTASDVYSLGVILYELLAGRRPYRASEASPDEAVRLVCTQDPERPSRAVEAQTSLSGAAGLSPTLKLRRNHRSLGEGGQTGRTARLSRQLHGDLDAIVMMAMRKEPARRYRSAEMLSEDIDRYLAQLPVTARQGSRRYHAARFLQRHRVEVVAAALVAVALLVGAGLSLRQAAVARRERDRAAAALAQAEEVTAFVMDLFRSAESDPARVAGDLSVRDLIRRGVARVDSLADQPAVQARLLGVIGRMQHNLGAFDDAASLLERAVAIRRTMPDRPALAESLLHLSWVYRATGKTARARGVVQEVLDIRRAALPPDAPEVAEAVYELGYVAATNLELEAHYREALAILQRTGSRPELQARLMHGLATCLRRQGRLGEALESDRRALDFATRTFGPASALAGYAMTHLADQVRDLENDLAGAEQLYRQGLDLLQRTSGPDHVDLIHPLDGLAILLGRQGRYAEAERLHREVLRIRVGSLGERHPMAVGSAVLVAIDVARQGRLTEAETMTRAALQTLESVRGRRDSDVANLKIHLAEILSRQGRHDEADLCFREALALKPEGDDPMSVLNGDLRRDYGRYLTQQRRFADAERELLRSLEVLTRVYGSESHPDPTDTKRALMALYQASGQPALVERYRVPPGEYWPY